MWFLSLGFATNKYDTDDIQDVYSHLTNTSINKFSPSLQDSKEDVGEGCKWTLNKLNQWMKEKRGFEWGYIWKKIEKLILLTILPIAADVKRHTFCKSKILVIIIFLKRLLNYSDLTCWLIWTWGHGCLKLILVLR